MFKANKDTTCNSHNYNVKTYTGQWSSQLSSGDLASTFNCGEKEWILLLQVVKLIIFSQTQLIFMSENILRDL